MSPSEKYFRRYLKIAPLGLALWRSVEAKHLSNILLKKPVLDIGCGFGEFAEAYADEPIDMGIDNVADDVAIAAKGNKYSNLTVGSAEKMPFTENSYASVFSISSLEHFADVDVCFKEAYRILKPNGILVVTMETEEVDSQTFYRPFFQKIGMKWFSNFLTKQYNTIFHRHNLYPKTVWVKKVEKAGFVIVKKQDIISPLITKLFDIFLITSWPSQIMRKLIGKRIVYRPQFIDDLLVKIFLPYLEAPEKTGTNLLIVAKKPLKKKNAKK